MRIRNNWIGLVSWRSFANASSQMDGNIRKLSSGLRVTGAADDAAGLGISNRILAQHRGLVQGIRNAMDGISLINTAEGALQEMNELLARGKGLSLQAANGTLTQQDRESIAVEVQNILVEIDRISDTTTFNNNRLFSDELTANMGEIVLGLKTSWLEQAADIIEEYLGMHGDGATLTISLESGGAKAAWITGNSGVNNILEDIVLHIDTTQFASTSPIESDRKVAAALALATIARHVDYLSIPSWFKSGVADLIAGRDEQLKHDIATYGLSAVIDTVSTLNGLWTDDNLHQSAAYLLVKYINWRAGSDYGVRDVIDLLRVSGAGADLDTSIGIVLGSNIATLLNEFANAGPFDYINFLSSLNLNDLDVGGVNPGDNFDVIPDTGDYNENPLLPDFDVVLSTDDLMKPIEFSLQVGANLSDRIVISIPHVSTLSLRLLGLDVVNRAQTAVETFDRAVQMVSAIRSNLGATSNRLDHAIQVNAGTAENQLSSYSRIVDVDMAKELTGYTRQQIMVSASGAVLAQANSVRQNVKWLLNGLSLPKLGSLTPAMES